MTSRGFDGLRWLTDHAWPLWLTHGVDWERRAFHEHLDGALRCGAAFRRLRVAARQTYVFSKAAQHGVPRAAEAVALGLEFLRGPARLADGGYAWRFDLDNRPIDHTRDLYDHAFVLLALAAAAAVVGADAVRADALALADYLAAQFVHPDGGYRENAGGAAGPRRQNPHMHLFEAMLAAAAAFGDERFFACARGLALLFATRFFQAREGALPEYFEAALTPVRDAGRFTTEPGHHYEWVWLIGRYQATAAAIGAEAGPDIARPDLAGPVLDNAALSLFKFAEEHGLSPTNGLAVNGLWSDGAVADAGFRLWPQTERIKAVALLQPDAVPVALKALMRHLDGARPGLWIERMDAGGEAVVEPAPASSLYHLTAALTDDAVRKPARQAVRA